VVDTVVGLQSLYPFIEVTVYAVKILTYPYDSVIQYPSTLNSGASGRKFQKTFSNFIKLLQKQIC
jgi:hypothetical protein